MKNLRTKKSNKKGFTLIELIVVIAILAILALILVPTISNYVSEATESRNAANARSMFTEATAWAAMNPDGEDCTNKITTPEGVVGTVTCTAEDGSLTAFSVSFGTDMTYTLGTNGQLDGPGIGS